MMIRIVNIDKDIPKLWGVRNGFFFKVRKEDHRGIYVLAKRKFKCNSKEPKDLILIKHSEYSPIEQNNQL